MPDTAVQNSAFTWDPVTAAWIHERGPEIAPPPPPHDVHALQTYFWEPDSKQWIRTVLADRGRQLATEFRGAHVIPKEAAAPAVAKKDDKKKLSPMPLVAMVVVLLLVIGGIAVFASQSGLLATAASPTPSARPSVAASVVPTAAAPSPSDSPPAPSESAAPRTPTPIRTAPPGISTRMPDGTTVVYTGPTLLVKPAPLAITLTMTSPNGRPASGAVTVLIHGVNAVAQLDASGRVAINLGTANLEPSVYPLQVIYQGSTATVAQITVR